MWDVLSFHARRPRRSNGRVILGLACQRLRKPAISRGDPSPNVNDKQAIVGRLSLLRMPPIHVARPIWGLKQVPT